MTPAYVDGLIELQSNVAKACARQAIGEATGNVLLHDLGTADRKFYEEKLKNYLLTADEFGKTS